MATTSCQRAAARATGWAARSTSCAAAMATTLWRRRTTSAAASSSRAAPATTAIFLPVTDGFAGAAAVTVTESAGGGVDTLTSGLRVYVLPANVENLVIAPQGRVGFSGIDYDLDGEGNALDNRIVGNIGNNRLYGHGGNDVIFGEAGNDTLDGMAGSDVLRGGTGNDTYRFNDDATDTIEEYADEGFDTVVSAFSHTLAANVERLDLVNNKKQINGIGQRPR